MVSLHCRDPKEYFHLRAWLRCASFRQVSRVIDSSGGASDQPSDLRRTLRSPAIPVNQVTTFVGLPSLRQCLEFCSRFAPILESSSLLWDFLPACTGSSSLGLLPNLPPVLAGFLLLRLDFPACAGLRSFRFASEPDSGLRRLSILPLPQNFLPNSIGFPSPAAPSNLSPACAGLRLLRCCF